MAFDSTTVSKTELAEQNESLRAQMARTNAKRRKASDQAVMVAEVIAGGGAAGFIRGRYADKQILGLEADLVLGALLILGSWWVGGSYADHLLQLGAGVAAAYAAFEMKALGEKMRQEANKAPAGRQPGAAV